MTQPKFSHVRESTASLGLIRERKSIDTPKTNSSCVQVVFVFCMYPKPLYCEIELHLYHKTVDTEHPLSKFSVCERLLSRIQALRDQLEIIGLEMHVNTGTPFPNLVCSDILSEH